MFSSDISLAGEFFWKGNENFKSLKSGPIYMEDPVNFSVQFLIPRYFAFFYRIDELLDEVRDAESLVYTYRKEMRDLETQLKQQQNLYSAVRNDRTGLAKSLTEAHDEIADLKGKSVLVQLFLLNTGVAEPRGPGPPTFSEN